MSADLISRKALINILEDVEQDGLLKVCQIIELLEDQPKAYEDTGWIPVEERLPKERVRPICLDFDDYLVTINFGFGARVKTLKYGDGHWWNGPSIVDEYVIAWRTNPEPYHPERSNDEKE